MYKFASKSRRMSRSGFIGLKVALESALAEMRHLKVAQPLLAVLARWLAFGVAPVRKDSSVPVIYWATSIHL